MAFKTSDRWVQNSMKKHPEVHVEYAKKFVGDLKKKLAKPGITSKDRARIYKKMKGFERIRKKFKSGKGLN